MSSTKQGDKRRFPRLDSLNLISYTHFDKDDVPAGGGMGRTLDLSRGGVTIQTHVSFPVDSGMELEIALEDKLIRARGRVVHVQKIDDQTFDVGICFTQIEGEDLAALERYFSKLG